MLIRHGYGVLLLDRRGEGASEGDYNAFGWSGEPDLRAAIAFLRRQPDVDPARIGGLGLSVGGELLLQTAAAHVARCAPSSPRAPASARSPSTSTTPASGGAALVHRDARADRGGRRALEQPRRLPPSPT